MNDGGEARQANRGACEAQIMAGRACLRAGDHARALAIAERLLADHGESPPTLLFAGEVHFARGNFVRAETTALRCAAQFPEDVSGPVLRCRALLAQGRLGDARDLALELSKKELSSEAHVEILVTVLAGCMEVQSAYELSRKAVARDAGNPAAQRRLALACRMTGRLQEAADAADVAINLDEHHYEMIGLRSAVHPATAEDNHIAELEALLATGCRSPAGAARVCYALAKEYEDLEAHEKAFRYVEAGARFKRQIVRSNVKSEVETHRLLEKHQDAAAVNDGATGFGNSEPIFVLGLPRTGSTLIERILASHSAVHAAGELLHLNAAMMQELRKLGPLAGQADLIRKSLTADPQAIGSSYIERTRPFTGHTARFVDKRPLNYLSIGVIHRALPNARVIHVRRTPLDACYAIFKFLFNDAYPWSYDLDDIARYYVAYRRLMDHWRSILPGRIIDIAYEDVVKDLEGSAKELFAQLELEWEPACLDFHEGGAATMTGSAVQVRQPLYASSVGRWRYHEKRLASVAATLRAAGIDPYRP